MRRRLAILFLLLLSATALRAQSDDAGVVVDYSKPQTYVIGGVKVTGNQYLDAGRIISLAGFQVGKDITIPSEDVALKLNSVLKQ